MVVKTRSAPSLLSFIFARSFLLAKRAFRGDSLDKTFLASRDFSLQVRGERTYLTANCPAKSRQISKPGDPKDWPRERWNELLREAGRFAREDLMEELRKLRNDVTGEWSPEESPVLNDDAGEIPRAVHTLRVHYSRENGYVRVRGTSTHEHRRGLMDLGLRWSPENHEWYGDFSEELLRLASGYAERNDVPHDPEEIGYERCANCGGFRPEGKACSCRS